MKKADFSELADKTCVITGGAGVIGSSIVDGLAAAGMNTVILDINAELAEKVAGEVKSKTGTRVLVDNVPGCFAAKRNLPVPYRFICTNKAMSESRG